MPQNLSPRNLQQWLDYISQLHPKEMDLGLERVIAVAKPLGWQQFSCPVVTVTGTNGKGSCVKFLESIYSAAGYRVGAFTSPHLSVFNERIRIVNQMVNNQELLNAFKVTEQNRQEYSLSFFEFTFLAALQIFQAKNLDLLILEVGLGGRLDAVNIVDADIAVITTIDLDHTEWLGPDRASIAKEKAGIFRPNCPVVCGDPEPPHNLKPIAAQLKSSWYGLKYEFGYHHQSDDSTWQWWGPERQISQLPKLALKHQNAATSLMVVELLQSHLPITEADMKEGLAKAWLPGRFEKMSTNSVSCYLDVAHNPQGGHWLAEQWQTLSIPGRRIAVLGMLADKDIAGTVQPLLHYVDHWYVASLACARGAKARQLHTALTLLGVKNCEQYMTVEKALQSALAVVDVNDSILIFGSFYTVAQARQYLLSQETKV